MQRVDEFGQDYNEIAEIIESHGKAPDQYRDW
jgi:hypothetical protein